ncbi:MAG TPA: site-specific integrase [Ktedonobacteraceae bacterium]|nr:site-specific integrase [Ktedonobacteraceae bacterium]
MSTHIQKFRIIRRPVTVNSAFSRGVVDAVGRPHLPLTTFYHRLTQQLADGTARTYLNSLLGFFTYLTTDSWRLQRGDQWNSPPDAIQEAIRDFLVEWLHCKVQPKNTYAFVTLTAHSPNTIRLFLAALKQFYAIMIWEQQYSYTNPLLDVATRFLHELEREEGAGRRHRMPQVSGVEDPVTVHPSENFFRLAKDPWEVTPVDDPTLGKTLVEGFSKAGLYLRDQIVIRMALESGARISEILQLTVGDWRALGCNQEARACSKGSRGRRVKRLRFSSTTARMLRQYLNTDRVALDLEQRRLDQLDEHDPLFLSQRRKPYGYEALKPHWKKLCLTVKITLNIHAMRHWYTTMCMRMIVEEAKSSAEIVLRKEELVRYMAWRNPETLKTYENYFKSIGHYTVQDLVHEHLENDVQNYVKKQSNAVQRKESPKNMIPQPFPSDDHGLMSETTKLPHARGWEKLLALGGAQ